MRCTKRRSSILVLSMDNLFVTGLWRVDAKYNFESYIRMLPLVIKRLREEASRAGVRVRFVVCTNQEGVDRIKVKDPVEFVKIEFDELPSVPSVSEPCGLKLGWMLNAEKLNGLNRVWANKIFLMDEMSRRLGDKEANVIWIDAGLKHFEKNFPIGKLARFNQIKPGEVFTKRYPNPDRVKHCRCSIPHWIRAGLIGCHRSTVHEFSRAFSSHMGKVSEDCGSWDEETILSSLFLGNKKLFKTWSDL